MNLHKSPTPLNPLETLDSKYTEYYNESVKVNEEGLEGWFN